MQVEVHLARAGVEEGADRLEAAVDRRADRVFVHRVGREQREPRLAVLGRFGRAVVVTTCSTCSGVTMAARLPEAGPGAGGVTDRPTAAQRVERGAELADLGAGQVGEEVPPHAVDVDGRGGLERGVPGVGEHRQGHPPVGALGSRATARRAPGRRAAG